MDTSSLELTIVGVKDLDQAIEVCKELSRCGVNMIELCAAFGNEGAAKVSEAVGENTPVGAVMFDMSSAERLSATLRKS